MVKFDDFGPEKILEVYNPKVGMRGFVVIDNTTLGPGKGGIRMTPSVSVEEVYRLARAMTWKCSLAGLPFGGAKSGIIANDRAMSLNRKKELVEAFSKALKVVCPELYVAAPDMNMAEREMKWYAEANGSLNSCTGKPRDMGGIPHELGSTGLGVYHATLIALKHLNLEPREVTIAIEGFGNVGSFAAKFLSEVGCRIVGVSDSKGLVYKKDGLDFKKLSEIKKKEGSVIKYSKGHVLSNEKIIELDTNVLITAAIPDLIKAKDIEKIKAKLIVEGSNIPMKEEVEQKLHKKGVLVVPDFVANAGGVISSYVEYIGGTVEHMFEMVEEKITKNTEKVLKEAEREGIYPRKAALNIAKRRILKKM